MPDWRLAYRLKNIPTRRIKMGNAGSHLAQPTTVGANNLRILKCFKEEKTPRYARRPSTTPGANEERPRTPVLAQVFPSCHVISSR